MSTSLVTTLADIAKKPNASMSTSLIVSRRICREFSQRLDSIHDERRVMQRKANLLRQHLPFTSGAIAEIEQRLAEHRSGERDDLRNVLACFGRSLVLDTEGLAIGLGFDRLCDLLAINAVERETARKDGFTSIAELVFACALEESAARRDQKRNDAPLFSACALAISTFIRECPEHLLPDPFAPGAPFGPKLPPDLRIVEK